MKKSALRQKVADLIHTVKTYWNEPSKGNYVPYKEIASISGAGFGVHWTTLLASTIALNASNFLVGACIGLKPMDLQIMLNVLILSAYRSVFSGHGIMIITTLKAVNFCRL